MNSPTFSSSFIASRGPSESSLNWLLFNSAIRWLISFIWISRLMSSPLSDSSRCLYSLDWATFLMALLSSIYYSLTSELASAILDSSIVILALKTLFCSCKFSFICVGERGLSKSSSATFIGDTSFSSIYRMVVDSLLVCLVVEGMLLGGIKGIWPTDPIDVTEPWRRKFKEVRLEDFYFMVLRPDKLSSLSRNVERTAISMKSRSLGWKGLSFSVGPPSGAGFSRGNLSVIYRDLQYLLMLKAVSAIIEVFSWPILTWR